MYAIAAVKLCTCALANICVLGGRIDELNLAHFQHEFSLGINE